MGGAVGVCVLGEPVVNPESAFLVAGSVCVVGQRGAVGSSLWEVECGGIAATGWQGGLSFSYLGVLIPATQSDCSPRSISLAGCLVCSFLVCGVVVVCVRCGCADGMGFGCPRGVSLDSFSVLSERR